MALRAAAAPLAGGHPTAAAPTFHDRSPTERARKGAPDPPRAAGDEAHGVYPAYTHKRPLSQTHLNTEISGESYLLFLAKNGYLKPMLRRVNLESKLSEEEPRYLTSAIGLTASGLVNMLKPSN